jgi:hypothetical protein
MFFAPLQSLVRICATDNNQSLSRSALKVLHHPVPGVSVHWGSIVVGNDRHVIPPQYFVQRQRALERNEWSHQRRAEGNGTRFGSVFW